MGGGTDLSVRTGWHVPLKGKLLSIRHSMARVAC